MGVLWMIKGLYLEPARKRLCCGVHGEYWSFTVDKTELFAGVVKKIIPRAR